MDKELLRQRITEEGQTEAVRRKEVVERQARNRRTEAAANEVNARATGVVNEFRDFVMAVAPDEVLIRPDQYDYHAQRAHEDALKKPAGVEINLGAYEDPELGLGTAKATVSLWGAPAADAAPTPYGALLHTNSVSVHFEFNGDGPNPRHVPLGGEIFDPRQAMRGVYGEYRIVDEGALPAARERVEAMEATAGHTLEYLTECVRDAELNPVLAARFEARAISPAGATTGV
ncbi:MAG TPA: hypothetical protein VGO07_03550 [Candidatus Saccharimonadales bacterium]|nr:hypothetical protein [Candidatus Saccharimonadales bacterium]